MKETGKDSYRYYKTVMELYIETLTGTTFELRVSPFETIASVKSKIQRLEGIPIQQQHLIWNSVELDDDYCLHDYHIHDGATLKMVLAMRGGPINTRRSEYTIQDDTKFPDFPPIFHLEVAPKFITCTRYSGFSLSPPTCTPVGNMTCLSFNVSPITPQYLADQTGYRLEEIYRIQHPVPMEDPTIREMAEYMEANRDEILEKLPNTNKQVTLLVFREGDQLNFFRVVDKKDGSLSPLSESLSGASVYNLGYDDDDEEDVPSKEKVEENEKTNDKMRLLKQKMNDLSLNKKQPKKKLVPRPPSSGRPSSRTKFRVISGTTSKPSSPSFATPTLNKNPCLPPVGCSDGVATVYSSGATGPLALVEDTTAEEETTMVATMPAEVATIAMSSTKKRLEDCAKSRTVGLERVLEDQPSSQNTAAQTSLSHSAPVGSTTQTSQSRSASVVSTTQTSLGHSTSVVNTAVQASPSNKSISHHKPTAVEKQELEKFLQKAQASTSRMEESVLQHKQNTSSSNSKRKEITLESLKESLSMRASTSANAPRSANSLDLSHKLPEGPPSTWPLPKPPSAPKDKTKDVFGRPTTSSSKYGSAERRQGIILESLSPSEARTMSGLLRQASLERLGSSKLSDFVRSASKSRAGLLDMGRIPTPEGRIMSSRLQRLSASRDGRVMSPGHRLPPVKQKKKSGKRCYLCAKKTGLATSYQCRCGNNFCATHRYAESHDCTFDYKTEGRKLLEQSNPVVNAPKLPKI